MQLTTGSHWRTDYLYLDHADGSPVTILDVTNPAAPFVSGQIDIPNQDAGGRLGAVVGTAALVALPASSERPQTIPQTIEILSFAEPEHPSVVRQFAGVTSMLKDETRGLMYLANVEGLWVLRMEPATDVQLEKQYEHHVLYSH
jgi:hypothetical protein